MPKKIGTEEMSRTKSHQQKRVGIQIFAEIILAGLADFP